MFFIFRWRERDRIGAKEHQNTKNAKWVCDFMFRWRDRHWGASEHEKCKFSLHFSCSGERIGWDGHWGAPEHEKHEYSSLFHVVMYRYFLVLAQPLLPSSTTSTPLPRLLLLFHSFRLPSMASTCLSLLSNTSACLPLASDVFQRFSADDADHPLCVKKNTQMTRVRSRTAWDALRVRGRFLQVFYQGTWKRRKRGC